MASSEKRGSSSSTSLSAKSYEQPPQERSIPSGPDVNDVEPTTTSASRAAQPSIAQLSGPSQIGSSHRGASLLQMSTPTSAVISSAGAMVEPRKRVKNTELVELERRSGFRRRNWMCCRAPTVLSQPNWINCTKRIGKAPSEDSPTNCVPFGGISIAS